MQVSASGTFLGCFIAGVAFFLKASLQYKMYYISIILSTHGPYMCLYSKILHDLMDQDQSLLLEWVPILAVTGVLVSFLLQHEFLPPPHVLSNSSLTRNCPIF